MPDKFSIFDKLDLDENDPDRYEIIKEIRDQGTIKNYLAIPTPEEIITLDSYTMDEMEVMMRSFNGLNINISKAFQKELDGVVHPTEDYSSVGDHHQPHFQQSDDMEQSIKEMFNEYVHQGYVPEQHEEVAVEGNADIYKLNSYHEFNGCHKFDTFLYKMLTYYSLVYRIFKLEYFTCKSNASLIDVMDLERYVFNGRNYWKMIEIRESEATDTGGNNDNFEVYSDSDDSGIDQNVISKTIINQIVKERRRRVKLQDDLENLYIGMTSFLKNLDSLPEKNLNTILEYTTLYHENRYNSVMFCIDKVLEKLYETKDSTSEQSIIKQVSSLHTLSKKMSNRELSYTPWFNHRYYSNFHEYYVHTKEAIDEKAMSPKEIGKLETLYPSIRFSENVFSGQCIDQPYECLNYEALDLTKENRAHIHSSSNTLRGIVKDYLDIFKLSNKKGVANLREQNDIIKTFIMRNQLESALFTWYSNCDYPANPAQYDMLLSKFKEDLHKQARINFKNKILDQKQTYLKSIESIVGPTKFDASKYDVDMALTPLEKEKLKFESIKAISRYTLIEMVAQSKSEIIVMRDEIDRIMMSHAIDIIEKEYGALSTAIDCEATNISSLIHPFQQFTSVCFPTVDKHSHLDMINKVAAVQK